MFRKVMKAGRYLATVVGTLSQFAGGNVVAASPTPATVAQEAVLKARINDARVKLGEALSAEANGVPGVGKLAQWFNWPNWQNWYNGWRNW